MRHEGTGEGLIILKVKSYLLFLIGAIILCFLIFSIGLGDVLKELAKAEPKFIVIGFLLLCLLHGLRAIRWDVLLNELNLRDSAKVYFIGQAISEIAPMGSGEVAKILIAKRNHSVARNKTIVAAAVERFFDVAYLLVIATVGLMFLHYGEIGIINISIPTVLVLLFGLFLFKPDLIRKVTTVLGSVRNRWIVSFSEFVHSLQDSVKEFHEKNRSGLLWGLLLTMIAWMLDGLCHFYLILAFGYDLPLHHVYSIVAISWLLGSFTFLPGGLGAREGIYTLLLETQSIPKPVGLAIILIQRSLLYILFSSGTLVSIIHYRIHKDAR